MNSREEPQKRLEDSCIYFPITRRVTGIKCNKCDGYNIECRHYESRKQFILELEERKKYGGI